MDKIFQLSHGMQLGRPGRFGVELAEATAKVPAFKAALGTRMAAGEKPLGARQ
jgi:hypothetical protein